MSHGHSHGHGGCSCGGPDAPEQERGDEVSLFPYIETGGVRCLNEAERDSVKRVIRPWSERQADPNAVLESDSDEELLIFLPFTVSVKLKSLTIVGVDEESSPANVKAFINKEDMDFDEAQEALPTQSWECPVNLNGDVALPTRISKFQNVNTLILFVNQNFGAETTKISYISLKGEATQNKRGIVETVYEIRPTESTVDPAKEIPRSVQ